mgnify:FL=1
MKMISMDSCMCGSCCQLFILSLPRLNVHMHCSILYLKSYYASFFTFTDLLGSLKSRLSKLMPSENVKKYIVPWSETGRINQNEHSSYLKQLGQDFFEQAKRIIDESAANESLASKVFPNAVVLVLSPGGHLVHIQEWDTRCVFAIIMLGRLLGNRGECYGEIQ